GGAHVGAASAATRGLNRSTAAVGRGRATRLRPRWRRVEWAQDQPRRTSPPPRPSPASGGGRHRLRGTNGCQRNDEADTVTRLDGSTRAPLPPLAGEGWDGGRISRDGRRPHRGPPPRATEGNIGFVGKERGRQRDDEADLGNATGRRTRALPPPLAGEGWGGGNPPPMRYQIRTRSSGAIHSRSPSFTSNASYHASMLRNGANARMWPGEWVPLTSCWRSASSRHSVRQTWAQPRKKRCSPVKPSITGAGSPPRERR